MIKIRTEEPVIIKATEKDFKFKYMTGNPATHIETIQKWGIPFYVRDTEYSVSIILDNVEYFYSLNDEFKKHLYLIRLVKKDFKAWVDAGNKVGDIEFVKSSSDNCMFDKKRKTRKYDIDHAYWQIARNHGMITESTYNHGVKIKTNGGEMKKVYCTALSVQGSGKTYTKYKEAKKLKGGIQFSEKEEFREMYDFIRNKTYYHMDWLAWKLGNEFKEYNVDAIEFADTKNNCTFVEEYFKENNLSFKTVE